MLAQGLTVQPPTSLPPGSTRRVEAARAAVAVASTSPRVNKARMVLAMDRVLRFKRDIFAKCNLKK